MLDLVVVFLADDDGVELDLVEPDLARDRDAREDAAEVAAARHRAEPVGVEAVERNVDAPEAGVAQGAREGREAGRVRRQGDVVEAEGPEVTHDVHDERRKEGLSSREPDPAHARANEAFHHDLPGGQVEALAHVAVVPVRAAVDAREVAPVGEREPHGPGGRSRGLGRGMGGEEGEGDHES